MPTYTTSIITKDVAKLVREALRAAFPGVKFSVRCGTGTGSAWINVSYVDGPPSREVDAVTMRYTGRRFNGMTDSYDECGTALIAFEGDELPQEVNFHCDGINSHRTISPEAVDWAVELVRKAREHHVMTWQDAADGSDEMRHGDVLFFNDRAVPYYGAVMHVNEPAEPRTDLYHYAEKVAHQFDLRNIAAVAR